MTTGEWNLAPKNDTRKGYRPYYFDTPPSPSERITVKYALQFIGQKLPSTVGIFHLQLPPSPQETPSTTPIDPPRIPKNIIPPPPPPPTCLNLDASTPCGPSFAGWPIQKYPGMENLTAFSQYVTDQWGGTISQYQSFAKYQRCGPFDGVFPPLRYQQSIWCALMVVTALQTGEKELSCRPPTDGNIASILPCEDVCAIAGESLERFFGSEACPKDTTHGAVAARRGAMRMLRGFCSAIVRSEVVNAPTGEGRCLAGAGVEAENCVPRPSQRAENKHAQNQAITLKDDLDLKSGFKTTPPTALPPSIPAQDWSTFINGANLILAHYAPHQLFSGTALAGLSGFLSPVQHVITREKLESGKMSLLEYVEGWNVGYFVARGVRVVFREEKVGVGEVKTDGVGKMVFRQVMRFGTGEYKRWLEVRDI
ncbi:hypothetical protein HDV00_002533 [Rhizophlyctis rosea]|nr:hypothetical protein HDV00_002533 [Rhizophlyctis rosea]